ncbi:MAG: alpha/beta hydrolase, partial [Sphingomonadaceae bacterium]|nr:alpha/beta hydrolase [Sphingomonadaceae bacterium]
AADDDAVDPENSLLLWRAAQAVGVSAELHLFPHGGHGFGTRLPPGEPAAAWPLLLTRAAAAAGVFTA